MTLPPHAPPANLSPIYANAQYSNDLESLPAVQRDVAEERVNTCQELLTAVQQQATALAEQAENNAEGIFTQPSGAFERYCHALGQVQVQSRRLVDLLRQVEEALSEARLTEPEQRLLDALSALIKQNGPCVDIGLLLQSSGQPVSTIMALLGTLYTKRKVFIALEPVTHAEPPQVTRRITA